MSYKRISSIQIQYNKKVGSKTLCYWLYSRLQKANKLVALRRKILFGVKYIKCGMRTKL